MTSSQKRRPEGGEGGGTSPLSPPLSTPAGDMSYVKWLYCSLLRVKTAFLLELLTCRWALYAIGLRQLNKSCHSFHRGLDVIAQT